MTKRPNKTDDSAEMRRHAEARLRDQQIKPGSPIENRGSEADTRRLLHELEVHQVELEMQNEELAEARDKTEALLEKYTDFYDFAPVGYLTLDQTGTILEANLAAANLLEVARSALASHDFGQFVSATDRTVLRSFLERIFSGKIRQCCEVTLQVPGQPPLAVELEGIVYESGKACRLILTDITELKRAEADRLILNKLESTGILAGGIAHDFNNLLTVILLNVELAQMLEPPGEELAGYLAEAKKASLLARSLTAQLVTFAGGGGPVRQAMFLSGLIQESVQLALIGSQVRCDFLLAEDLWAADVDAGQIGQVIRNLILNAREAMPTAGTVTVSAKNVVPGAQEQPALPAGEYVQLKIADQGTGIAKDVLPKIFDPYFSTKQRGMKKGMGLGLTICHSIIQKHQGAITVESTVGVGTTFHIYLPANRKLRGVDKLLEPADDPRPARILVMDDDEGVKELVGQTLSGMGHTVELAKDGRSAIELYQTANRLGRRFDVVILDLTVYSGMGGQETLEALLKLDPGVQAIAMSGNVFDPVLLEPERHGFKGALTKPFEASRLRGVLAQVTSRSPAK
jgi:signal transduction histidine kinase/ActR/RegA family two-component response regulator